MCPERAFHGQIPTFEYCLFLCPVIILHLGKPHEFDYFCDMKSYQPTHRMRDIIADNNLLLMALSRFGISLGFGDNTIDEVCRENHVDTSTFLAVANFISGKPYDAYEVSLPSLIGYLKDAHSYFLDFILPSIRTKLVEAISSSGSNDVALLILKFYDDYVQEVHRHMEYENDLVFGYVEQLLAGHKSDSFSIAQFLAGHTPIASKLHELKEIFICHFRSDGSSTERLNSVLFNIITCEHDLLSHCQVEDQLFVPAVEQLEREVGEKAELKMSASKSAVSETVTPDSLTEREKEIIRCVARGLSNKEIADHLCVSVHTVTTHRRNICAKLEIHSSAALAIYAIIHGLLDLSEIKPQ